METLRSGFFKLKVAEHDCALNPADAERYLKLIKRCMERTQKMTASGSPGLLSTAPSPKFNNAQCKYLADKLESVVESAESFLDRLNRGDFRFHKAGDRSNCLEVFKLLCSLAAAAENFIQSCCKDLWIQAAVFLPDASEHVWSISFDLQLCKHVFLVSKELRQGQNSSTLADNIFKDEVKNVKEKASQDRATLLRKVNAFIGKEKSTIRVRQRSELLRLADLLLQRLELKPEQPVLLSPEPLQDHLDYPSFMKHLEHLVIA